MMKIFIFSLLFVSLCLSSSCNTTQLTCGNKDDFCTAYCTYPLTCQYDAASGKFKCKDPPTQGTLGQSCPVAYTDCLNVTGSACVNGTCQLANYLGVGEACSYNEACVSKDCSNGTCNETALCYGFPGECGYNKICPTGPAGPCGAAKVAGDACTRDGECSDLLSCSGGKCTKLFSVADGATCSADNQCSGCLGCKKDNNTAATGICAPVQDIVVGFDCDNSTDNYTCTNGPKTCFCTGSKYQCIDQVEVKTSGGCSAQFDTYETCIKTNKCGKVQNGYSKWFVFASLPSDLSCERKNCKTEYDCLAKCQVDLLKINDNLPCGKPAYDFTCAVPLGCAVVPTTSTTDTGASTTDTSVTTSTTNSSTAPTTTTPSTSTTPTTGPSTTNTSTNTSTTPAPTPAPGPDSTTGFGVALIAPLLSIFAALFF